MTFGLGLRAVGLLRRIAIALEDANEIEREKIARANPPSKASKLTYFDTPKVEDWNEGYRKELAGE